MTEHSGSSSDDELMEFQLNRRKRNAGISLAGQDKEKKDENVILGDCRQIISSSCAIVQSLHKAAFKNLQIILCEKTFCGKKTFIWYWMGISEILGEREAAF
ncbi:hypothetical protein AV530_012595 [Patagioenas fasciata monilis]|uniref:Uncharacterized protein n=1 Tax=Patagioenas fasciata monilis TaxID=372326 RepID=A0A1V4JCT4_PATFA|nr:hypothetical protein AV530_012595 [Patagioenas fasciata monilis]